MEQKETENKGKLNLQSIAFILLIVVVLGLIILSQGKNSFFDPAGRTRLKMGQPAPNFILPNLDDKMISLADYKGKVVLLNIWATWCKPCVEEMPSMEKLYQALKDQDFEILAVSIDVTGKKDVGPFMKKYKLNFTALLDTKGSIKVLYQTTGVPESFIIDKQGILVEKTIGARDWAKPETIKFIQDLAAKDYQQK